ncbi:PA0069 family radical SAM protein [bacterium]|nr:PA0069 family radical SAM protein [bacterium]
MRTTKSPARGAVSNPPGRFAVSKTERDPDIWWDEEPEPDARTEYIPLSVRTIIAKNDSPDIPFSRSINPYNGCEHGCVYCYARPSHAFHDLSPGLDFETRIFYKPDAVARLRAELSKRGYAPEMIALGTNTDPYQPAERRFHLTRGILETLLEFGHPFGIVTKSSLVLRDLDILKAGAAKDLCNVFISVTTLSDDTARKMEPRGAVPAARLRTIRELHAAGVPVGVMVAPVVPGLTDHEIDAICKAAADAGAASGAFQMMRLPFEVKQIFADWLGQKYPDRANRVLNRVRDTRGGELNSAKFGERIRGTGVYAEMIATRFAAARKRYGLDRPVRPLSTEHFRVPPKSGDQMKLV